MQWTDNGFIIHVRPLGESQCIVNLFTHAHGRQAGAFRLSKKNRGMMQVGQNCDVTWRARLETQLGSWALEPKGVGCATILSKPGPLCALQSACALLYQVLPEGHGYPDLFDAFTHFLSSLSQPYWIEEYIHFEAGVLSELGYGLDLTQCALTGRQKDLVAVSPRTGRAVSAEAARPYQDKLLPLPAFLREEGTASYQEKLDGLALTGYFLDNYILVRKMPPARDRLVDWVRGMENVA